MNAEQKIKPYGHFHDDGMVQVSFTLPLALSQKAQQAALGHAQKMGLNEARVTWMEAVGDGFTYFVIYGKSKHALSLHELEGSIDNLPRLPQKPTDVDKEFRARLGRRAVIFACTGNGMEASQADFEALLSLKGISGEIGLEGYTTFSLRRIRHPKHVDEIVDMLVQQKADALLVCEPSSGWGKGEKALKELAKKISKINDLPDSFTMICWRQKSSDVAQELSGYQFSIGRGMTPSVLADRLVSAMTNKGFSSERGSRPHPKEAPRKRRGLLGWLKKD